MTHNCDFLKTADPYYQNRSEIIANWCRLNPMALVLLVTIGVVMSCYYLSFPVNLLADTEFDGLDTVRVYRAVVRDIPNERAKTFRYLVAIPPNKRVYLYLQKSGTAGTLNMGDTILVKTAVRRGGQLGDFNYGNYLRLQNIVGYAYADSLHWRLEHTAQRQPISHRRIQNFIIRQFKEAGVEGKQLAILSALTLGYREDLDDDTRRSFQKAGAMHVLAVSGLHTGIVMSVILAFLTLFGKYKPIYEDRKRRLFNCLATIACLIFYAWMTGLSPSVVRSVLMLSLIQVAMFIHARPVTLNIVAASAFFILFFRPTDLFSVSFQLSYLAVLSIILFYQPIYDLLFLQSIPGMLQKFVKYAWGITALSIATQIGTIPITLYYFGMTSNYFFITNLIVIPLAWMLVVLIAVFFLFCPITPISHLLGMVLNFLTKVLNLSCQWVESLPYSTTSIRTNSAMMLALYGIILFSFIALKTSNNRWHIGSVLSAGIFLYQYIVIGHIPVDSA